MDQETMNEFSKPIFQSKFLSPSSFWVPEWVVNSAWVEHAPFAFWLMEAHRPGCVVELGTHWGYSYMAFCQAVACLQLDAKCYAIDTWTGDEQAGFYGPEVYTAVKAHNDSHYASFSTLIRATFDDALGGFVNESIDLLHIDGLHTYDAVKHDYEAWYPKVSERGIILVHDINVREREFGVWQLWEELKREFPYFEFAHGHGLGVLGVGRQIQQPFQELFSLSSDAFGQGIRATYARLGAAFRYIREADKLRQKNADHERRLSQFKSELAQQKALLAKVEVANLEHLSQAQLSGRQLREKDAAIEKLSWEIQQRQQQVQQTSDELRKSEAARVELQSESATKDQQIGRLEAQIAKITKALVETESANDKLTKSFWWKMTKPLRKAEEWFRGDTPTPAGGTSRTQKANPIAVLFDAKYYLETYPDVPKEGLDPLNHYIQIGWRAGKNPHPLFDTKWYLEKYRDVRKADSEPLLHYLRHGWKEGRIPHPLFDTKWYLSSYPDVVKNPLVHFCKRGWKEGRKPAGIFSDLDERTNKRLDREVKRGDFCSYLKVLEAIAPSLIPARASPADAATKRAYLPEKVVEHAPGAAQIEYAWQTIETRQPLVSIIMPTWNRKAVIDSAVRSALGQSYPNFEIVIVDDGSTDGTYEYLTYVFADEIKQGRMKLSQTGHVGVSHARNRGLEKARGEIIAYLDSDNQWRTNYLLFVVASYVESPEQRTAYTELRVRDDIRKKDFVRRTPFDLEKLRRQNYIDLNVYSHRRELIDEWGGFDERLTRLVDWDLILRQANQIAPTFIPLTLVDYNQNDKLRNISHTEDEISNRAIIEEKDGSEKRETGVRKLKLAYVLWDYPSVSQTFVHAEIEELLSRGVGVRVYYKVQAKPRATLNYAVESYQVEGPEQLAELLRLHGINHIHSHFAYPATTLLAFPTAEMTATPFSFAVHAVDIYLDRNRERNRIVEVSNSKLCRQIIGCSEFHYQWLLREGVSGDKVLLCPQAYEGQVFEGIAKRERASAQSNSVVVLSVARFIEKKGLLDLVEAAALCQTKNLEFRIYGYGEQEEQIKQRIEALRLANVHILGSINRAEDRVEALDNADMFVLPCKRAANGDMDGMPTVLYEAAARDVPIIAGKVSCIPDFISHGVNGFLVPEADPEALARTIDEVAALPRALRAKVASTARETLLQKVGAEKNADAILDVVVPRPVDILLVCHLTPAICESQEIFEARRERLSKLIESIGELTSTPFQLILIDNACSAEITQDLTEAASRNGHMIYKRLDTLVGCGEATNVALEMGRGEFLIYLCSNEAFITKHGWERPLITYMRSNPQVGLGGHLVINPNLLTGEAYSRQEWFSQARAQEYVLRNRHKIMHHVQGGAYILRRKTYESCGGFHLPHNSMDVEYSILLEANGWELGDIPSVVSVSNKTLPGIRALLHENVSVVHPVLKDEEVELIKGCVAKKPGYCNLSGEFEEVEAYSIKLGNTLKNSKSTGFSRRVNYFLSRSEYLFRGLRAAGIVPDPSLQSLLHKRVFSRKEFVLRNAAESYQAQLKELIRDGAEVIVAHRLPLEEFKAAKTWDETFALLAAGGVLICSLASSGPQDNEHEQLDRLCQARGLRCDVVSCATEIGSYGLEDVFAVKRNEAVADEHGIGPLETWKDRENAAILA